MKHILFSLLIIVSGHVALAQLPVEPCCAIVGINPPTNMVTARNSATGRLFMFRVSPAEISTIKLNDPVSINNSFTYVVDPQNGNNKYFVGPVNFTQQKNEQSLGLVNFNYTTPCCAIVSIENTSVAAQNRTTGEIIRFTLPVEIAKTLKLKDPVYVEPGQGTAMAIIQSSINSKNGYPDSYSFPVEMMSSAENLSSEKWELVPQPEIKNNVGRLNTHFPDGVEWGIDVYTSPDRRPVMSRSTRYRGKPLFSEMAPGNYDFRLGMVMIENVPIVLGKETRLKSGVLQINKDGRWELYDEFGKKPIMSGIKATRLALPVGNYQLKMFDMFAPFFIRDGETTQL